MNWRGGILHHITHISFYSCSQLFNLRHEINLWLIHYSSDIDHQKNDATCGRCTSRKITLLTFLYLGFHKKKTFPAANQKKKTDLFPICIPVKVPEHFLLIADWIWADLPGGWGSLQLSRILFWFFFLSFLRLPLGACRLRLRVGGGNTTGRNGKVISSRCVWCKLTPCPSAAPLSIKG